MAAKLLQQKVQQQAYRIVRLQIVGVCIIAAVAFAMVDKVSAFSVLTGGMTYALPNLVFVWAVFRFVGAQQMAQFVAAFFAGEMIKLLCCALLFLMVVKYLPVSLLSVLIGFIGSIISFWIVCFWLFAARGRI